MKLKILVVLMIILAVGCSTKEDAPITQSKPTTPIAQPTCTDGVLNQGEADIDCGGPCKACPSCSDGIQNQGATAADCGGPCKACATCDDGLLNQNEQDVDCGGVCKPCPVGYETTAEDYVALDEKVKLSMKGDFLTNSYPSGLEVGESHVFALGIRNTFIEAEDFMVELEYKRAVNTRNNPITADPDTMQTWVYENNYEDSYTLDQYKLLVLPVGVTVGDEIAPGKDTVPGTYYFVAKVKYQKTEYTAVDYAEFEFSVRVV